MTLALGFSLQLRIIKVAGEIERMKIPRFTRCTLNHFSSSRSYHYSVRCISLEGGPESDEYGSP